MPCPQPSSDGDPRGGAASSASAAKTAVRDRLLTTRRRRPLTEVGEAARAITAHLLGCDEVRRAATVAAYVSVGTEPGTSALLDAVVGSGLRVVLPLLQPDDDLDWARYEGPGSLASARLGLLEPTGAPLGRDAVATADVVLVPGLACSADGLRLGRGGGSYDRALGRVPVGTFTCVLLYDGEIGVDVPGEPHDRRVAAAVSPAGIVRFGPAERGGGRVSR